MSNTGITTREVEDRLGLGTVSGRYSFGVRHPVIALLPASGKKLLHNAEGVLG
jgi:hypothetical protein